MGFFSDLKDDLSQAVNELLPSEGEEITKDTEQMVQPAADVAATSVYAKADMDISDKADAVEDTAPAVTPVAPAPEDVASDFVVEDLDAEYNDDFAKEFSGDFAKDFSGDFTKDFNADFNADFSADLNHILDKPEKAEMPKAELVHTAPVSERKMPDMSMQSSKPVSGEVSVLTESMIINGNIATEGALEVRGRVVGNVEALGKLNVTGEIQGNSQAAEIYAEGARIVGELRSQSSIKIGQNAVILGNVYANSAVIAGAVRGDLDIRGPVILDTSAIVMGDIKSKSVQINNGAVVEGMCSQCYAEVNPTSFFEELKKMK